MEIFISKLPHDSYQSLPFLNVNNKAFTIQIHFFRMHKQIEICMYISAYQDGRPGK
jgi:hypothetical protein